jgi:hypothetical protein
MTPRAGPRLREIHHDVVCRGRRLVVENFSESSVHTGSHLGGVHGGKRIAVLVLHECGVAAILGAQQSSALQPVDPAKLTV